MYSLVIVEDEFTTRRALANMARWEELGFRVDGVFADGQELLDYLKNNIPDVVLTDIKLVNISGIEIARFVDEQNLPVQVVFLSAYRDFSFAQEAVKYHVAHYLLKPVELSKLREVFRRLKEKLDKQNFRDNMLQERDEHYNRLVNYEKQQLVTDVYFGSLDNPEKIARRLGLIDSGRSTRLFQVELVVHNDQQYQLFLTDYGLQELQEQIIHILGCFDQKLEFYPIIWNRTKDEELSLIGVFWENDASDENNYTPQVLQDTVYNLLAIKIDVSSFLMLQSLTELVHCAEQIGKNETANNLVQDKEYLQFLWNQNKLLCSFVCQNNIEQGIELTHSLINNYLRGGMTFAQRQCVYIITKLLDEIVGHDPITWNQLYTCCMTPPVFSVARPEELKRWMERCVKLLFDFIGKQAENKRNTSIEKVMEYLYEHYREDITLASIAEAVFLNPAYISRLIKEQTGKNYVDLVMEMRIERAVELLEESDMYVYEIAEKVGYNNLKYFYKVFRKIKGKSPSDYRPTSRES